VAKVYQVSDNPLLTVDEVAARLRLSRNKVYELLRAHEIPHIRLGRKFRIPARTFEQWIAATSAIERPDSDVVHPLRRLVS